jgi:L-aspartate oxidase
MRQQFDYMIIGSGAAGLSFALKVAGHGKVAIVTKTRLDEETNTSYAQGGISSVTYEPDNFEKHISDTLIAGDGLCDIEAVTKVVTEAPEKIRQLIDWGTQFDKDATGRFDLHREGGHCENRILHHKDSTGAEIQRALTVAVRNHPNIQLFENHFAVDLITPHHLGKIMEPWMSGNICYGAYILNKKTKKVDTFLSKVTLMATGGVGNVYQTTTNPLNATGDGIAMVFRAKGIIENMEFIQFHPTALYKPSIRPAFLITEAMRGFGGILRTMNGEEFMHKYDERGCLAPRDIVARAIESEMKNNDDHHVYLDVRHKDSAEIKAHFPTIYEKCLSLGLDITREMIPVVPAAHYLCGGIKVDSNGLSSIKNLYAAGECSSTGLHGANRLASNSLIEAVVYADAASRHAISIINEITINEKIPDWNDEGTTYPEEMVLIPQSNKEVEQIMTNYVGIVRSNISLNRALDRLEVLYHETETLYQKSVVSQKICELRNKINVGYLIIKMAKKRKESRGLHYTIDYPGKLE